MYLFMCRSEETLTMNEWHELRVSRTGREGILPVDNQMPTHSLGEVQTFMEPAENIH